MSESPDQLNSFLQAESQQGVSQGEGGFTLDVAGARRKLSEFSLPQPGLWVVKLVQAAVAASSSKVAFTFSRKRVRVKISGARQWCPEKVRDLLLRGLEPPDDAYFHLRSGLMGACGRPQDNLQWSSGGRRMTLKGAELIEESVAFEDALTIAVSRSRTQRGSGILIAPIRHLFRQTAHEFKALHDRCAQAPIEVLIDNHPLEQDYLRPVSLLKLSPGANSNGPQGWNLALALKPVTRLEDRPDLSYPPYQLEPMPRFTTVRWPHPGSSVKGVLCLYECRQRSSRVHLMLDGVRIEERLPLEDDLASYEIVRLKSILEAGARCFAFELYLNTRLADLDLSQFATREPSLAELVLEVVPDLIEVFSLVRDQCEKEWDFPPFSDPTKHFKQTRVVDASVLDLAATLYLTPFLPHMVFGGGAYLLSKPLREPIARAVLRRRGRELRTATSRIVEQLRALWDSHEQKKACQK